MIRTVWYPCNKFTALKPASRWTLTRCRKFQLTRKSIFATVQAATCQLYYHSTSANAIRFSGCPSTNDQRAPVGMGPGTRCGRHRERTLPACGTSGIPAGCQERKSCEAGCPAMHAGSVRSRRTIARQDAPLGTQDARGPPEMSCILAESGHNAGCGSHPFR